MLSMAPLAPMLTMFMQWSMSICMMALKLRCEKSKREKRITDERLKYVKELIFNQLAVDELGKNVMIKMHLVLNLANNNMYESVI